VNLFSIEEAGDKGASRPFPLHPKSPPQSLRFAPDTLRTFLVDEAEHFLHNHHASVASLRLLFTFVPERRSASLRNRCSPSPEYPIATRIHGFPVFCMIRTTETHERRTERNGRRDRAVCEQQEGFLHSGADSS